MHTMSFDHIHFFTSPQNSSSIHPYSLDPPPNFMAFALFLFLPPTESNLCCIYERIGSCPLSYGPPTRDHTPKEICLSFT